ncbi:MAG: hypothetical protein PHE27_06275 [Alphaproteobacteria bacterium]|nr:hypothetical protein [Alphaproteobacteria bacterium]
MPNLETRNLVLKTLDEVPDVSSLLARHLPDPLKFRVGLYELLVNAIEHGNLGLGYETKAALLRHGEWEREIKRRMSLPEYRNRKVDISIVRNHRLCCIEISDQGKGFCWKKYMDRIDCGPTPNGRGLLIAKNCGFQRISFNRAGNKVTCVATAQTS